MNADPVIPLTLISHFLTQSAKAEGFEYVTCGKDNALRLELAEALAADGLLPVIVSQVLPIATEAGFTTRHLPFRIVEDEQALTGMSVAVNPDTPVGAVATGLYFLLDGLQYFMTASQGQAAIKIH